MLKVVVLSFIVSCMAFARADVFLADAEPLLSITAELFDCESEDSSDTSDFDAPPPGHNASLTARDEHTRSVWLVSGAAVCACPLCDTIRAPPANAI